MENPLINPHNFIDFPLNSHALPLPSGIKDVEMITLRSKSYTSLKDLMPASPPSVASPTGGSWREIPIKDPLLQHAAWAYLQPMVEARDEEPPWWRRLEKKCCSVFDCFNEVVLVLFGRWFAEGSGGDHES